MCTSCAAWTRRGIFANPDEIIVTLKKVPDARQLLLTRGFHWLNETPFIR